MNKLPKGKKPRNSLTSRQRGTGALGAKPHSPIRRQGFLSHGDNITDGAVIYDSAADTILSAHELQPAAISDVIAVAQEALAPYGGVGFGAERLRLAAERRKELGQ